MTINLLEAKSKNLALLHRLSFEKCPPPYSEETFYRFLKDKNYHLSQEDNKGFAFARVIADTSELITLAVNPQFRRRGVAQKLLRQLIRKIKTAGANQLTLEVAENNIPAIRLYKKLNFEPLSTRKNYFSTIHNNLDAIVFIKLL